MVIATNLFNDFIANLDPSQDIAEQITTATIEAFKAILEDYCFWFKVYECIPVNLGDLSSADGFGNIVSRALSQELLDMGYSRLKIMKRSPLKQHQGREHWLWVKPVSEWKNPKTKAELIEIAEKQHSGIIDKIEMISQGISTKHWEK